MGLPSSHNRNARPLIWDMGSIYLFSSDHNWFRVLVDHAQLFFSLAEQYILLCALVYIYSDLYYPLGSDGCHVDIV